MADNTITSVLVGVGITIMSAGVLSIFKGYTDLEILKERVSVMETNLNVTTEAYQRLDSTLTQIDKNVAVQTEILSTLKTAVKKLEAAQEQRRSKE